MCTRRRRSAKLIGSVWNRALHDAWDFGHVLFDGSIACTSMYDLWEMFCYFNVYSTLLYPDFFLPQGFFQLVCNNTSSSDGPEPD
jgi:hypothetical protein